MIGRVVVGILAVFLLLGAFASQINTGIKGWRTTDTTQVFAVTTTSSDVASVTLTNDLYQAATGEVIAVTANITETPVVTGYTEATKALEVSNLALSSSRYLTVRYYAESEDVAMRAVGPFLFLLIIGGLLGAIFMGVFQKGGRRR